MRLSVVIATRDRAELLRKTLLSLTRQTLPADAFEVLVCDHESSDHTLEICRSLSRRLTIRVVDVPYAGYSIQKPKNAGILEAKNELLLILDCGVVCPPQFLEAHLKAHLREPNLYVAGPVYGWECEEETPYWKSIDPSRCIERAPVSEDLTDCRFSMLALVNRAPWLLLWGCNFSVLTRNIREAGAYDEAFSGWGWDDIELGIRLQAIGLRLSFDHSAWCLHYPHPRRPLDVRLKEGTRNWVRTYNKHPRVELELWEVSDYEDYELSLDRISGACLPGERDIPAVVARPPRDVGSSAFDAVYWGFNPSATFRNPVVSPLPTHAHSNATHSFGIRTPFSDGQFGYVLMSDYWRHLTFKLSNRRPSVLYFLLKEAARVGEVVVLGNLKSLRASEVTVLMAEIRALAADSGKPNKFLFSGDLSFDEARGL
jgi:glycosyltransferase involved in cell wall biosynthesis